MDKFPRTAAAVAIALALGLAACRDPVPEPVPDPLPEPQATTLRDSIQAPIDKAKAVESASMARDAEQRQELEDAGG